MNRVALGIEYDGSAYCGWQRLGHAPSVQETLETALSRVANEPVTVTCAGRTDSKVHAQGQVIHFEHTHSRQERAWTLGVNAHLPDDISVVWSQDVGDDFHARFGAFSRSYRYVILNRNSRSALLANKVTHIRYVLDADVMHQAAQQLLGEHDFSSFRAQGCQARHPHREVTQVSVTRSNDLLYLDISANAFLYHMVRNIAGVLIEIGRHQKPVSWVSELMQLKDRTQAAVTAPPNGLYLVRVDYPQEYNIPRVENPISFG